MCVGSRCSEMSVGVAGYVGPVPSRLSVGGQTPVSQGPEVDLVLERTNGRVVGIEVKATDAINQDDFKGLTVLRDQLGDDFVQGLVLYTGPRVLSFGDRLTALPLSALWDRRPTT